MFTRFVRLAILALVLFGFDEPVARAQTRGDGFVQGVLPVGQVLFGFAAGGDVHLLPGVGLGAEAGLLAPFCWYFTPYGVIHLSDRRKSARPFLTGGLVLARRFDPDAGDVGATTSFGVDYWVRRGKAVRFEVAFTRLPYDSITWMRVGLAFR